jgi:hypothetical protein
MAVITRPQADGKSCAIDRIRKRRNKVSKTKERRKRDKNLVRWTRQRDEMKGYGSESYNLLLNIVIVCE